MSRSVHTAFAAVLLVAFAGCDDAAVTDVTGERPVLNVLLAPATPTLPRGSSALHKIRIENFDTSLPDAFARGTGMFGNYVLITTDCCGTAFAFDAGAATRNSVQDPRLPALMSTTAAAGEFFGLFNPAWAFQGPGWWNLFGIVRGLKPNATYTVVLARMAMDVRGVPDQEQRLTGHPVTEPDSLYFLGGTPAAPAADVVCDFSQGVGVTASQNPLALGTVTADGAGVATVDCLPVATGDSPWWRDVIVQLPFGAEDSLPVGRNELGGSVRPGQYNYVLLYEGAYVAGSGDPTPTERPALRVQLGPDIDAAGAVIANAFAPFPLGVTDTAAFRQLPGGGGAFAVPSRIALELSGLPPLAAASAYQVFLHSSATGAFQPVRVTLTAAGAGTNEGAATFASPGVDAGVEVVLEATDTIDFGAFNSIIVSIEPAGGSAAPSRAGFLFAEYRTADRALRSGALTLGSFDATATQHRAFHAAGSGSASFFADSLLVQVTGLIGPPGGFHYQSYLTREPGAAAPGVVRLHTLLPDALGRVRDAVADAEVPGGFRAFTTYVIVLEPDGSPGFGAAPIQVSENYADKFPAYFAPQQ